MGEVVLEARGLAKGYGAGAARVEALRGVDLTVRAGEFVAVLGPSGSGKSTLLNLLGLMDRPSGGEVLVAGRPAAGMSEDGRAALRNRHVGFVFQFDALMPEFTVLENVLMPGRIAAAGGAPMDGLEARARELLSVLGVEALAERFPPELSGGERQRAALARALLNKPGALLADEPTGNLDRPNAELVFSRLKELAGRYGVAIVMVTHNEDSVGYASRTVRLRDGRLAEERP
ncbi:MAG: lipoprotein-releasing system ATP-binding protein [Elusimicrobia bacterium]|nr:MAG: lipoprotein-releasing system ATP-binding protein [Elusimicrobiota bacterium]